MLAAVLLAALLRVPPAPRPLLVAFAVALLAALVGGFAGRTIRRSSPVQVVSAAVLAAAGVPVELAGGATPESALAAATAWVPILAGSALLVRAAFARAARGKERTARWLEASAVTLPGAACAAFAVAGYYAEARAAGVAALGSCALVLVHPTVKRIRQIGIALASLALASALVLGT